MSLYICFVECVNVVLLNFLGGNDACQCMGSCLCTKILGL